MADQWSAGGRFTQSLPLEVATVGGNTVVAWGHGEIEAVEVRTRAGTTTTDVTGQGVTAVLGVVGGRAVVVIDGHATLLATSARRVAIDKNDVVLVVAGQLAAFAGGRLRLTTLTDNEPVATTELQHELPEGMPATRRHVCVVDDHRLLWAVGDHLVDHDVRTGVTRRRRLPHEMAVRAVVASPSGEQVAIVDDRQQLHLLTRAAEGADASMSLTTDASAAVSLGRTDADPLWLDDDTCTWVSREWPHTRLHTAATGAGEPTSALCPSWTVARLVSTVHGPMAIATWPGRAPQLVDIAELLRPVDAEGPTFTEVAVPAGRMRAISHQRGSPTGTAVLLRGGPYGEWWPSWDPIVDTLLGHGLAVHQIESPYTASIQGRFPKFRRGDFGVVDARAVADAVLELLNRDGLAERPLFVIGHSYGAYLAARAQQHLAFRTAGLVTMNGPWTTADMIRLSLAEQVRRNRQLSDFLWRGFDLGAPLVEPDESALFPKFWLTAFGRHDEIIPADVLAAAAQRDQPYSTLSLEEGHVPRSRIGVTELLDAIDRIVEEAINDHH